jgi:hypothetical protein
MRKHETLLIGSLTFLTLLTFSIVFYKERTCFLDASYHLFYILKDGDFAIQNNRFGAFFTQMFPLIGSKLGLSLSTIAVLYSMSFVVLPFLTFLLIHIGLKNSKISVAYLLFNILMTTHTFYWVQSELPQAMAYLFILIALLDNIASSNKEAPAYFWLLINILCFTICFTHPLILIPFSFLIIFFYISYSKKRAVIASVGLIYIYSYLIKVKFFKTPYDSQALDGIKNFTALFPNYFDLQSNKNLIEYFIRDYYFAILFLVVCLIFHLKAQQYKKTILLLTFFAGYCLLINVSYPNGAEQFYIENQYMVVSFIVAIPFVCDILPKIENYKVQYSALCLICIVGLLRIVNTHDFYSKRLDWNRDMLSKTEEFSNKKLIIPPGEGPLDTLLMTWGSSYEFWLLSTMESGVSRSIIIEERQNEFDWALPSNKAFISKWGNFNYADLNKQYFSFNDTTSYMKSH